MDTTDSSPTFSVSVQVWERLDGKWEWRVTEHGDDTETVKTGQTKTRLKSWYKACSVARREFGPG